MIVSHRHKFIYLRTEKTASTSLSHALESVLGPEDVIFTSFKGRWVKRLPVNPGALKRVLPQVFGLHFHAKARHVRQVLGRKLFDGYFKFAVERNPWERQVSLYNHRKARRGEADPRGFDGDMSNPLWRAMHHTRLHNWEIYAIGDDVVADRVIRYEALETGLSEVFDRLGIDGRPDLPRLRSFGPPRAHYSTYYSNGTRDLVGRWYRREIEAFGYAFEADPAGDAAPASARVPGQTDQNAGAVAP